MILFSVCKYLQSGRRTLMYEIKTGMDGELMKIKAYLIHKG